MGFKQLIAIVIFSIITFTSCNNENTNNTKKYIFLSHTYQWYTLNEVDHRIPKLNLEQYDMIWLGGDLCVQSSSSMSTLNYLNKVYNLSSPNTLWAVGNHDILKGSIDSVNTITQRESFYTISRDNIVISVLNTNLELSYPDTSLRKKKYLEQYNMLKNVSDTISKSIHYFIIGHNIVWEKMESYINTKAHTAKSDNFDIDKRKNFLNYIYPLLKKIKAKNIQVTWIAGDIGKWLKKYEYWSKDSIQFMANGINNTQFFKYPEKLAKKNRDQVLIFKHNIKQNTISWDFYDLNFLVELERIKQKKFGLDQLDYLCLNIDSMYENKGSIIENTIRKIKKTPKWNKYILDYSKENNVTYKDRLYEEANYIFKTTTKTKLNKLDSLLKIRDFSSIPENPKNNAEISIKNRSLKKQEIILRIKKDSVWFKKIKAKALKNKKSIDQQLNIEAEWLLNKK